MDDDSNTNNKNEPLDDKDNGTNKGDDTALCNEVDEVDEPKKNIEGEEFDEFNAVYKIDKVYNINDARAVGKYDKFDVVIYRGLQAWFVILTSSARSARSTGRRSMKTRRGP